MQFLDIKAVRCGFFGGPQGVVLVRGGHLLLDWEGGLDAGSGKFQSSIGEADQSVLAEMALLLSIGVIGVSVMIMQVCCHGSASSFPSIQEGMLSTDGLVKF